MLVYKRHFLGETKVYGVRLAKLALFNLVEPDL